MLPASCRPASAADSISSGSLPGPPTRRPSCAKILDVTVERPASRGPSDDSGVGRARADWREFWQAPWPVRAFVLLCATSSVALAAGLRHLGPTDHAVPAWLTVLVLVLVSIFNVEMGRALSGGLASSNQPHKALSAWAFACALLLPTPWLLVVVPVTYAHARLRGLRVPLWKWVGSGTFLVIAGVAAAVVRHFLLSSANWMAGDGDRGLVTMLCAAAAFLLVESLLFVGPATLNRAEDEAWLRRTLRSPSYYATEAGVLLIGGLLSAVWTGGAWFIVLFLPIYGLAQRAVLHDPLRERADTADELASENVELARANQFKIDLLGMLGHEIGSPLTALSGYAQIGSDALLDGDVRRAQAALVVVERNSERIRLVLHEILAMVSSEGNALTAHREDCLLEPRLDAGAATQPDGNRPVVDCVPGLTAFVQPGHLDQMLTNLLTNAEKYAGGATCISARPDTEGRVMIEVQDSGPGVPDSFRDVLFQRFTRDAGTARKVTGTGLGLFITRELARANGGDVAYRSHTPSGSIFVITLPTVSAAVPLER